jgi:hypothetical protein
VPILEVVNIHSLDDARVPHDELDCHFKTCSNSFQGVGHSNKNG